MDVIVTKWVGLEGTAILATEHREELSARYAQPFLDKAAKYIDYLSIRSEAAVAAKSGVAAMHDLSEEAFSELSGSWGSVPASDWKLI